MTEHAKFAIYQSQLSGRWFPTWNDAAERFIALIEHRPTW